MRPDVIQNGQSVIKGKMLKTGSIFIDSEAVIHNYSFSLKMLNLNFLNFYCLVESLVWAWLF